MRRIRKAQITAFGGPERVDVVEAEIAGPSPREVRLAVEVAEFSGADINMRRGTYPFQRKAPLTPGYSVVGRVESRGADARVLAAGDRVVALTIYGGEAELVNVAERDCYRVPAGVASEQAVCLILDWLTAYQMLHRAAHVRRGQRLFVHGVSGAVGRGLLGLGLAAGAEVTGTASARYHDDLRSLGATPFSYDGKGWIDELRRDGGVDAVFDPLGFESFDESYAILRPTGTLVGYGFNLPSVNHRPPRDPLPSLGRLFARNLVPGRARTTFFGLNRRSRSFGEDLRTLLDLAARGEIVVPIKSRYPLERIREAHEQYTSSPGMGSSVVTIASRA